MPMLESASAFNFVKKDTPTQVFSCEFYEFSRTPFFTEHLWITVSDTKIFWKTVNICTI